MSDYTENNNKLILTQKESGLVRVGNSVAITNRLLNQEISDLFNQGFCKLNSQKIKSVDRDYLFELEHSSNHQIVNNFGFRAEHRTDYEQALDLFNQVLKLKPNHSLTYTMIGICISRWSWHWSISTTNKYLLIRYDALFAFSCAIELDSTNAIAFFFRAIEFQAWNDNEAIADSTRAVNIDNCFSDAYLLRCQAKVRMDDWSGAIADCTMAIVNNNSCARAFCKRGLIRKMFGEYQGAIEDLTRAMEIDSNYNDQLQTRGELKLRLGDTEGAKRDFEQDKIRKNITKL